MPSSPPNLPDGSSRLAAFEALKHRLPDETSPTAVLRALKRLERAYPSAGLLAPVIVAEHARVFDDALLAHLLKRPASLWTLAANAALRPAQISRLAMWAVTHLLDGQATADATHRAAQLVWETLTDEHRLAPEEPARHAFATGLLTTPHVAATRVVPLLLRDDAVTSETLHALIATYPNEPAIVIAVLRHPAVTLAVCRAALDAQSRDWIVLDSLADLPVARQDATLRAALWPFVVRYHRHEAWAFLLSEEPAPLFAQQVMALVNDGGPMEAARALGRASSDQLAGLERQDAEQLCQHPMPAVREAGLRVVQHLPPRRARAAR